VMMLGAYIVVFASEFAFTRERLGIFFPIISIEFVENSNEILKLINRNETEKFSRLLDISIFFLSIMSAYSLLVFDFFKFEFWLKKTFFYSLLLCFIILSIAEYFFWFHLTASNKQEMIYNFKIFSFLIILKWIFFFLSMAFLGFVIWLEGRFYLLKLAGFFYISAFVVFLFHFKIQQLIDLGLILIGLGFVGNWLYFAVRMIQLKGVKK
ncbi:MAG: hypothetical protein N3A69_09950, partial [Leptospiraceae bacterium]|nr:hypothetical protein [Leptospiraceae bacterium]